MPLKQIISSTVHPTRRLKEGTWHFARTKGKAGRLFHKFKGLLYEFWDGEALLVDGSNRMSGNIRLERPVWDDLQVALTSVKLAGVSDPTWQAYKGGYVLKFAKNADNILYFITQLPHDYKQGANIEFHLHLAYPDSGAGSTVWNFTHSWANLGSDFPAATTVSKVEIVSPEDTDTHQAEATAEIASSISGTGKKFSSVLICSLQREGTDATVPDDYDNVVYLVALDFHVPRDSIGSATATVK